MKQTFQHDCNKKLLSLRDHVVLSDRVAKEGKHFQNDALPAGFSKWHKT